MSKLQSLIAVGIVVVTAGVTAIASAQESMGGMSGRGMLKGGGQYENKLDQSGMSGMSGMAGTHAGTTMGPGASSDTGVKAKKKAKKAAPKQAL
jgi:hypothetical protein